MEFTANILDPIHDSLPASVWDNPASPRPHLKPQHRKWIIKTVHKVLSDNGYTHIDQWLTLVLTGSLTTYQYGNESDCDVSLFVDAEVFPEWSRAEMIGLMVSHVDGTTLPGTGYPMQCFVVAPGVTKEQLYQPGLRSGYDLENDDWIQPPDRARVHNVEQEMNGFYVYALEQADKMERLLRYEPDKAKIFWHQIHQKRQRDQRAGKGDYSESNIVYKFLANRGLFPDISKATGEYIAKTAEEIEPRDLLKWPDFPPVPESPELQQHADATSWYACPQCGDQDMNWRLNVPTNTVKRHCDVCGHEDIFVTPGGKGDPLEQAYKNSRQQDRVVTKFVYDPLSNHLVVGRTGQEEGEHESHKQLLDHAGINPASAVFGQFDTKGRVETFGRPLIRGFGQHEMSPYESDYRLKQALEEAVPGINHSVFEPPHSDWANAGPPEVTMLGDPPTITPDYAYAGPQEGEWDF